MSRLTQFRYNIPSFNLVGTQTTFRYNVTTSSTPSTTLTEFTFHATGRETGFISQQVRGNSNWAALDAVRLDLSINPRPANSRALTFPFGGCTWIFGINANSISAFHDSHPLTDLQNKNNNLFARFSRLLRLEHIENTPLVRASLTAQQLARVHFEDYSVPQLNPPRNTSAIAYAEFEASSNRWRLFVQDCYPVVITVNGRPQNDHQPQDNRNLRSRLIA